MSTERPLKICFVASEVAPFAKTGGLADVAAALPAYLHSQGHDVRLFMPLYSKIDPKAYDFTPVDFLRNLVFDLGRHRFTASVFTAKLPGSELPIYFLNCPALYHRPGIYTGEADEHLRFTLLAQGAIACCQHMGWSPDLFHCNDWHTALIPLYLKAIYHWDRLFADSKSLLTIHNIAYQGVVPATEIDNLGLSACTHLLHQDDLSLGAVSLLKTGLLYADVVSTVSRTYAQEIQTAAFGRGLEDLLQQRSSSVVGIVNGVDYSIWDPATDPHIPHQYSVADAGPGKEKNKAFLFDEVGLPHTEGVPLLGIVSRMTAQKGFDLLFEPLPELLRHLDVRLMVLGTGEPRYESFFSDLQRAFPGKVCYYRGYHERLAHLIEAASDIFLMPSQFEPCGLNQMYSLRYGAVPVVRKTGGLADTVELYDPAAQTGTGFVFEHFDAQGLTWALRFALTTYQDRDAWERLRQRGMEQDFSWDRQGTEYETLYRRMIYG